MKDLNNQNLKQVLLYALLDLKGWIEYYNDNSRYGPVEGTISTIKEIEKLFPEEQSKKWNKDNIDWRMKATRK